MAKAKAGCSLPCGEMYDKEIEFIRSPDGLDETYEINTRDWSTWIPVGGAYGSIKTQGNRQAGRQFEIAGQAHGVVDAIITTQWNEISDKIDHGCAIKIEQFGRLKYYQILSAINVDEQCVQMMFICRNIYPGGIA